MEKPFAITLEVGSSLANKTGSWRTERPVYIDRLPPCADACPAGENVQQWLYHAEEAGYEAAWRKIMEENPFPAVMGRVCYRPCETACNRRELDNPVGINAVERFLGDEAIKRGWVVAADAPPSGKRVLVVGAGPSGLSAAYHLTRLGHQVTIKDSAPAAGGMMRFGIPKYRLPRDVLDAEIDRILAMGVTLETGEPVTDLLGAMRDGMFDAVFLAVGAQIGKRAYIPAGDSAHILDAVSFLKGMEGAEPPMLGRSVVVYGGGNTAIDAARTARRLGATDALIVYRRTRERMPAHDLEVDEALEEGVRIKWLSTISHAEGGQLMIEKMALDDTGFPQPTGEFEELPADAVVLALGQAANLSLLDGVPGIECEGGVVKVGPDLMTGHSGVFAGGDMIPSERTVTVAIGHGKKAARHIDAWLRGVSYERPRRHELASYDQLNTWYYSDAPATERPRLDIARRISTFDEVVGGLDEGNALFEARRCLSCGNCFECDNCYAACPEQAITRLGPGHGYSVDLNLCTGCATCFEQCPCHAIEMAPEPPGQCAPVGNLGEPLTPSNFKVRR
ncbi:MAG: NAD(P)-binding protein [Micromonosporaceae bacterium]